MFRYEIWNLKSGIWGPRRPTPTNPSGDPPMRIAWFSHRYQPCVGGAENYGRAMVRRFVAAGGEVDVITSNAQDLWYFTDRGRRRVDGPLVSWVDGARVRRFPVRHLPGQRYVG